MAAGALALAGTALGGEADPFAEFVSPVSNPVNFEDPRPTTEIRPIYAYHRIDDDFATQGGEAHVAAAQVRVALGDRLGLIATKDGYVTLRPDAVLPERNGWANIAFGAKYALYRAPERPAMATVGLRYEAPWGNRKVLQGRGRGVLNPFLAGLWGVGDLHLLGYAGPRVPISGDDSTFFDLSLHADYRLWRRLYPLVEFNWIQTLKGGRRLPIDQEGFDFFNLGSSKAGGHGVVTAAFGARWRVLEGIAVAAGRTLGVDLGVAYELPLTAREDLFGWRVTSDVIVWLGQRRGT
jgi:hypothetical protein